MRAGLLALLLVGLVLAGPATAQRGTPGSAPEAVVWVIDDARALDERSVDEIAAELLSIQAETGVRGRLIVLRDLGGDSSRTVASRYLEPDAHNQLVLLLAMADREVRIETTPDLERAFTDEEWSRMLGAEMLPKLRAVQHGAAVRAGIDGVRAVLKGRYEPPAAPPGDLSALRDVGVILTVALLLALGLFPRSRARIVSEGRWR